MIKISGFTGLAPRIHPRKLPESGAQTAREVRLLDGNLNPLHDALDEAEGTVTANCKSFYPYNGAYLSWNTAVDTVRSPLLEDIYDRVYYTGNGAPKVVLTSDGALATGEALNATVTRPLGVTIPTVVPSAVLVSGGTALTIEWYYFYEETDGTRHDEGTFTGGDITTTVAGQEYTLSDGGALPPNGSGLGTLVVWFKAYTTAGTYLGQCYPTTSVYAASTDLVVNGAAVTCTQAIGPTSVDVELTYDISQQNGFSSDRVYVYTWVTDVGEESAPSDPLTVSDLSPVQDVELTTSTVRPLAWITHKRIYRSVTANDGTTQLRLVSQRAYNEATYTDNLLDEELETDVLATDGFDPPPTELAHLVSLPGGFLAGSVGRVVYFSAVNYPYAWPYSASVDSPVVAMAVAGNDLVIVTEEEPYLATGLTPEGMSFSQMPMPMAGTSGRGVASWMGRVMYTSPDGLVEVVQGAPKLVTEKMISREYWQGLTPTTMRMYTHDHLLLVATDTVLLLFTYADDGVTFTDSAQVIIAAYLDAAADKLHVVLSGETTIKTFDAGAERTMTWRGRDAYYPAPQKMGAYRVQAASYPLTLRVYSDDALAATLTVADGKAALMPSIPPAKVWSVEVEHDDDVMSIETGTTIREVMGG